MIVCFWNESSSGAKHRELRAIGGALDIFWGTSEGKNYQVTPHERKSEARFEKRIQGNSSPPPQREYI